MNLCECGCGQQTAIATKNHTRSRTAKGQPRRYIRGHNIRGGRASWWKGDEVGYRALHTYLNIHYPKSGGCEECGEQASTDYALIRGRNYTRNREDYRELCRPCHVDYDRMAVAS